MVGACVFLSLSLSVCVSLSLSLSLSEISVLVKLTELKLADGEVAVFYRSQVIERWRCSTDSR